MCFYIFSPDGDIRIKYFSEAIDLKYDGSSVVTTNIIISPEGNNSITKLILLYPNSHFDINPKLPFRRRIIAKFPRIKDFLRNYRPLIPYLPTPSPSGIKGSYRDITLTWLDKNSFLRETFREAEGKVQSETDENAKARFTKEATTYNDNYRKIVITPSKVDADISAFIIFNKAQLNIKTDISNEMAEALKLVNFTVFELDLSSPITTGKPRLFSWIFYNKLTESSLQKPRSEYELYYKDIFDYSYKIIGCHSVHDYYQEVKRGKCNSLNEEAKYRLFYSLDNFIKESLNFKTIFECKSYITIMPGQLTSISVEQSDLEPIGIGTITSKKYRFKKNEKPYEFIVHRVSIDNNNEENKFKLIFSGVAKSTVKQRIKSIISGALPIISIILVIIINWDKLHKYFNAGIIKNILKNYLQLK